MGVDLLDRETERGHLLNRLPPIASSPSLTLLQGPSGFGKTTLTDWIGERIRKEGVPVLVADPRIRTSVGAHVVPQGFYLQRCAEAADSDTDFLKAGASPFQMYLEGRDLRDKFKGYDLRSPLRRKPSLASVLGIAADVLERMRATGQFSPQVLFKSDSSDAALVCASYFRSMVERVRTVLIIREAQHCDAMSFEELLRINAETETLSILLEYTTDKKSLAPNHEKIVDSLDERTDLGILDLPALPEAEFRTFLAPAGGAASHDEYAHWDGNVRALKLRQRRINLATGPIADTAPIEASKEFEVVISELGRAERFLLAILVENMEPIPRDALASLFARLPENLGLHGQEDIVLKGLEERNLVTIGSNDVAVENDDVSRAARRMPNHRIYAAPALRELTAFYEEIFSAPTPSGISFVQASRQAVRLTSRSGDLPRLIVLLNQLDGRISEASDPAMYVSLVADQALKADDIGDIERRRLSEWAASAAYRSGDFAQAVKLLDEHGATTPYANMLLANACIETDQYSRVALMAERFRASPDMPEGDLIAAALEANLDLMEGRKKACRERLHEGIEKAISRGSVLEGTLLRLLESAYGARQAIEECKKSIAAFERHGSDVGAAYSRVAIVRHLARLGDPDAADRHLDLAEPVLEKRIASRQFLINNRAGIELLRPLPDFDKAFELLRMASPIARDLFSEIVVLHNTIIAATWSGRDNLARAAAQRLDRKMRVPGPTTQHLCVPMSHGLSVYFASVGEEAESHRARNLPREVFGIDTFTPYWTWRMGGPDPEQHHLAQHVLVKPYHPVFLSQWQLDEEIARGLTQ